jgi:hypothetical protein
MSRPPSISNSQRSNAEQCPFSVGDTRTAKNRSEHFETLGILNELLGSYNPEARRLAKQKASNLSKEEANRRAVALNQALARDSTQKRSAASVEITEYGRKKALALGTLAKVSTQAIQQTLEMSPEDLIAKIAKSPRAMRKGRFLAADVTSYALQILLDQQSADVFSKMKNSRRNNIDDACRSFMVLKSTRQGSVNAAKLAKTANPAEGLLRTGTISAMTRAVGMTYAAMHEQPALWGISEVITKGQEPILPKYQSTSIGHLLVHTGVLIPQISVETQTNAVTEEPFYPDMWRFDPRYISIDENGSHNLKRALLTDPLHVYQYHPNARVPFTTDPTKQLEATLRIMRLMPCDDPLSILSEYSDETVVGCPISLTDEGYAPARDLHRYAAKALDFTLQLPQAANLSPLS